MNKRSLRNILLIIAIFCPLSVIVRGADTAPAKASGNNVDKQTQILNINLFTIANVGKEDKKEKEVVSIVDTANLKLSSFNDLLTHIKKWWYAVSDWFNKYRTNVLIMFFGLLLTFAAAAFFGWFFKKIIIGRLAARTANDWDDKICDAVEKPLKLLIFTIGIFLSSISLINTLNDELFNIILRCFLALMAFSLVWGAYRWVDVLDHYLKRLAQRTDNNLDDLLVDLIRKAVRLTIVFIAALFIGQTILGLNITALAAGAGIAGLAVALAAKDTLSNFFGSVMIMLDKPFAVGERIAIDSIDGIVERVGFRSTRIRSLSGHLYSMPNSKLADSVVENITKRPYIKYAFNLTLVYDTGVRRMERALEILHEILDKHEGFNEEMPPRIYFTEFKDWSLNINVILWFQSTDYFQVQQWKNDINLEILHRFNDEGLDFAFPTSTNYLAGDASRELKVTTVEEKK